MQESAPFKKVPKFPFLIQILPLAAVAFFGGLFVLGLVAGSSLVEDPGKKLVAIAPSKIVIRGSALEAAMDHVTLIRDYWDRIPQVCLGDNAASDFQRKQCDDFWSRLWIGTAVCAIPFGVMGLFILLAIDQLRFIYRRARKKIEKGQAACSGVVTDPPVGPNDFFGWFARMQVIMIQLSSGQQLSVYIPKTAIIPLPGQTYAAIDGGRIFGARRYFGVLFAPHLDVSGNG